MIPTLSHLISAFLGDGQGQSPTLLSDAYSSSGSVGMYLDKLGRIRSIDGYLRQNSSAFVTDTGNSASMIRGLFLYRKIASGSITRQLLMVLDDQVNEWELHYSTDLGVTKTLIHDYGAGSVGAIPDFAVYGDQLYVANGVIAPQYWDGASLTTAGATQLVAPTLTNTGAGNLNGSYKYRVVPILANKTRKPGGVSSASIVVQNREVTVTWTADADGTVIGYEIYRTTGTGLDLYFVSYSDGRTVVTYADILADADLLTRDAMAVVAPCGDPPPSGAYFCVAHKGRMWWIRTDTYPRRAWWSDPGDADSVYTERSYIDCTDAASLGDQFTGGTGEFEGLIILWMERSIWRVSGTGIVIGVEIDWRKKRTNAKTGTVSARTVVRVSKGTLYSSPDGNTQTTRGNTLAFLTPQKDIRLFDGDTDTIISHPKSDTFKRMNTTHAKKAYAYDDEAHGMFVWVFPIDSSTEPNYSVGWNYLYGTWHEWANSPFGHVTLAESSTATSILVAGQALTATGGFIYKLWTGDTADGADLTATFMTRPLYLPLVAGGPPDYSHEKRIESVFFVFIKDSSPSTITIGLLPHDAADSDTPTISRTLSGSSRVRMPARMGASDTNPGRFFYGPGFRLKVTTTGQLGSWTLEAIETVYQALMGQSR